MPCCAGKSEVEGVRRQDSVGVTAMVVLPIALHPSEASGQSSGEMLGPAQPGKTAGLVKIVGKPQPLIRSLSRGSQENLIFADEQ